MRWPWILAAAYLAAVNLLGIALTVYDKIAAKKRPRHRIPEKTLLLTGALGGAVGMYAAMLLIRHKTRHAKFMLGLPAIALPEAALLWLAVMLFTK